MRRDLPTGTVTFVFTDIEGSTRMLEELGADAYGELLARHHEACRAAWARHGGVEVDTAGDAFFVAFPTASGALGAAADAQGALADLGLRVRMGVHTGEVTVAETGYVGFEVHRAARIAAAAHGGQVVVSASTAALVPADGLVDLGEHRFKDLAAAERVLPARRGRASAAEVAVPLEPAGAGDTVPRPRARARRGRGAASERGGAAGDTDRSRRDREDAAVAPGGGRGKRRLPGRGVLGSPRAARRSRARREHRRARARREGAARPGSGRRPLRAARRAGGCSSCSTMPSICCPSWR